MHICEPDKKWILPFDVGELLNVNVYEFMHRHTRVYRYQDFYMQTWPTKYELLSMNRIHASKYITPVHNSKAVFWFMSI